MNVVFDMETADPDDLLTLCFLARHPNASLVGVTVTPGAPEQIGLVRTALETMGATKIPVGTRRPELSLSFAPIHKYVSQFYYKLFSRSEQFEASPDGTGAEIIHKCFEQYPDVTLLTGASLGNLRIALETHPTMKLRRWVAQGGFAGDSLVEPEHRLEKFAGRETCPTFNFNGDVRGALLALQTDQILERTLVSKNVCHGVVYDQELHTKYKKVKNFSPASRLIYKAMDQYLQRHPDGKKLHDPLAACVMLDDSICQYREVEVYRSKGEWGSKAAVGTNTKISVSVDKNKFHTAFMFGRSCA